MCKQDLKCVNILIVNVKLECTFNINVNANIVVYQMNIKKCQENEGSYNVVHLILIVN